MKYIRYVKSKDECTLVKQAYNYEMSKSNKFYCSINNTIENLNKRIDEIKGRDKKIYLKQQQNYYSF